MFIYYFAHIPQPFARLAEPFEDHPDLWLPGCVANACHEAESVATDGSLATCATTVAVGPVDRGEGSAAVSIRVESREPGVPFTHLEADLEIAGLDPGQTQLTLRGSYRGTQPRGGSPLGPRHRRAEALAKAIVEDVADRLTSASVIPRPPAPGNLGD